MSKKIGPYIVASGSELKVRPTHSGYYMYHVVHENGELMGSYAAEEMATMLAEGLLKRDHKKLTEEMENILVRED